MTRAAALVESSMPFGPLTRGFDQRAAFRMADARVRKVEWSDDGQFLIAGVITNGPERTALRVPVSGSGPPLELLKMSGQMDEMRLSPDGKWLAYNAAISGRHEIYVSPVPNTGERIQVSAGGGTSARWRDDGEELYYQPRQHH